MKLRSFPFLILFLLSCLQGVLPAPVPSDPPDSPPTLTPGRSGLKVDDKKGVIHMSYGNRDLVEHMKGLQINLDKHPENNKPFDVMPKAGDNSRRREAMKKSGLKPKTGFVRDEKPLNMQLHDGKTTAMYVPKAESSREGGLASQAAKLARQTGYQVQLHPNPSPGYTQKAKAAQPPSRQGSPSQRTTSKGTSDTGTASPIRAPWNSGPGLKDRSPSKSPTPQSKASSRSQSSQSGAAKSTGERKAASSSQKTRVQQPPWNSGPGLKAPAKSPASSRIASPQQRAASPKPPAKQTVRSPSTNPAPQQLRSSTRLASKIVSKPPVTKPAGKK